MILPQPRSMSPSGGHPWIFRMRSHFSTGWYLRITHDEGTGSAADLLQDYLKAENHVPAIADGETGGAIHFSRGLAPRPLPAALGNAGFADERHRITISEHAITVECASPDGALRAVQTLRQLFSGQRARLRAEAGVIEDEPAMGWRGLHLDVARHFRDLEEVCRFIDLAALHKFNLFHWHLTDDQGWRLPVEGYPALIEVAAWREGTLIGHDCERAKNPIDGIRHGGFYTHDEIRRVVCFAASRGVRILPEIDMPGHVQALVTAYPEFGCTDDSPGVRTCWGISDSVLNLEPETFHFLEKLTQTLAGLFPFSYVHFGGDEARKTQWEACTGVRARMRELGLASVNDVQPYFTKRLAELASAHGRRLIAWDEIMDSDSLPPGAAVMYWRDCGNDDAEADRRALREGAPLVLANCSRTYFDLYQKAGPGMDFEPLAICGNLPIEKVYEWRPLDRYEPDHHPLVLGAQGQAWTEYMPSRAHLDYMVYPRACALAQVLWTGEKREKFTEFKNRLVCHFPRLDRLGVGYRPTFPEP